MAVSLAVKTSKGHTLSRMWPAPIGVISGFVWEPAVGFEPTACCLRNSCSAPELRWHRLAVTLIHRRTLARDERPQAVYRTITPSVKRHPSNERHPSRLPRPERQTCAPRTRLHPYEPTRSSLQLPPAPSSSLQLPPAPSSSLQLPHRAHHRDQPGGLASTPTLPKKGSLLCNGAATRIRWTKRPHAARKRMGWERAPSRNAPATTCRWRLAFLRWQPPKTMWLGGVACYTRKGSLR